MKNLMLSLIVSLILFFILHDFHTKNTIIAVLDTGISQNNTIKKEDLLTGFNFINPFQKPVDKFGHGTEVAEIIHHESPNSKILPVKIISDHNRFTQPFTAISILYSIIQGADVINMSFSYTPFDIFTTCMIKIGEAKGVVFVGAAGNESKNKVDYPANVSGVISVGAYNEKEKEIADYSNYGKKITVYAPGDDKPKQPGEGTSLSSAFVSGIVADMIGNGIETDRIKSALEEKTKTYMKKNNPYHVLDTSYAYAAYTNTPYLKLLNDPSIETTSSDNFGIKTMNLMKLMYQLNNQKMKTLPLENKIKIPLVYGLNHIQFIGYGENKQTAKQDTYIVYDKKPPELSWQYYVEKGKKYVNLVVTELSLKQLIINNQTVVPTMDFRKNNNETEYSFSFRSTGPVKVEAIDRAGNKTIKEF